MFLMRGFQLIRHCVSSHGSSLSDKWFLMLSNHLRFGLPLLLLHGTFRLSPSLSCPHILLLISIHDHPTSKYFHALFVYLSHLRYPSINISFIILSSLVTPLIHLNTLIPATYCEFFTAHVHWFLPGFSLLHTYPVLSLHTYLAVHSPYCASIILDEALYRTPSVFLHALPQCAYCIAIPLPGMKPKCASLSLLRIILSQIFKVYQLFPSAIPTILDVSLFFINWYNQTISPLR